jgi:hypothetical protein
VAEQPVAKFRRIFQARLASGQYEPIDVVQAVKGLSTSAQLVESLDIYCTLFDPSQPLPTRNALELARTTGYNLFMWGLELSGPHNELLELVRAFSVTPPPALKDAQLAKRLPAYRSRYESLSSKDRDEIERRAKKLTDDRAAEAASRRFLLDDLEKEFRNRNGRAPQRKELYAFDPGSSDARKEFEAHAAACQAAFFPRTHGRSGVWVLGTFLPRSGQQQPEPSPATATQRVETAFGAFGLFVAEQIKQPLDLFRLLAWAREPSDMNVSVEARGGKTYVGSPSSAWSAVWRELYQDIAARGLYLALTAWHIAQMRAPRAYVGKDLEFLLGPLEPHWKELLKKRLAEHVKGPVPFGEAQLGRRKVKAWGDLKGLELVDELESETQLKEMVAQVEADPKAVLARRLDLVGGAAIYQESYHIFDTAKDVFTVVWIPKQPRIDFAYVEVHAVPGFFFKAWGNRVGLAKLLEDQAFVILAANAAALAQFLLAYLQILGYVVDVITAGATGGIRVVVMRFVEERIKDKIISEGLNLAGVKNPWIHAIVGMAGGLAPSVIKAPKVGAVKVPDDVDVPKPKVGTPSAGTAASKAPAGPQVSRAPSAPPLSGDNVLIVSKAPGGASAARATPPPPEAPGLVQRATDYVVDVAQRATGRALAPAHQAAPAGAGPGGAVVMEARRLDPRGVSPGVSGGAGNRGNQRATPAVQRLEKNADFKLLQRYERELMMEAEKLASARARVAIANQLRRGEITEKEALTQIQARLNKAKESAGEYTTEADLRSNYDVDNIIAVPTRENGVPVLDLAVRLKKGSPLNKGARFAFGEAKGGLKTRLGKVTPKRYFFQDGALSFVPQPRRNAIRQASAEWFYQKFAEVYMMGQELGGAAGKKMQGLANEMFEAAHKGEIATLVAKSDVELDRRFIDSTDQIIKWFKAQDWDTTNGFPVIKR